jgi:transcriptional regulator with XRE-family HTH domain
MTLIGERLSEIRKDHGDTQADLAARLNLSLSAIRSWEQEKSSPPHEMLVSICKLYHVSSDYLLGLSDVDPAYVQRQRLELFTKEELDELRSYEEYLVWKKRQWQLNNHT